MKMSRHAKILELIEEKPIETQDELVDELRKSGFNVTQATISRDIKDLRLVKVMDEEGRYRYVSLNKTEEDVSNKLVTLLSQSLVSIDYAGNIIVLKTLSGTAMAAAAAIDALNFRDIVGTLAGDDTIFVLVRDVKNINEILSRFKSLIK
ncbi:transcriptional regulator, ArgR family [Caldanaerobius fijiensis DSM 17918]|uniref:Arginine repressor n=1 Tax=Caldanaerobius fijiensis DSM 17918 TaxID=1121256 RepID=A0A1M4U8J9_9THEO|nr:arginine repressor [Caldanaerobius fijiensis]SHE53045.1 transcriptional regulator, ArgR family [Caldanaerobius fijiensis DSM 17918]